MRNKIITSFFCLLLAVSTLAGLLLLLLAGVPLSECVLYTSGRVPMDMVRKAIRAGVPALVSQRTTTLLVQNGCFATSTMKMD